MTQIFDYALVNGALHRAEIAQVSLFHPVFLGAFGVYETVKVDKGRAFHLNDHLKRLHQSAQHLDLELPVPIPTLATWFETLLKVDREATFTLRILVLADPTSSENQIVAFLPEPLRTYSPEIYQQGATVVLYEGQRAVPQSKSLNTLVNYLARREATRHDALEALLCHDGQVTEGARSNVFGVKEGRLITPPAASVLNGITREIVVHLMAGTDHPVAEERLLCANLGDYTELFITATSLHVVPVTRLNGGRVGDGAVGPITRQVMARFEAYYQDYMRQNHGGTG